VLLFHENGGFGRGDPKRAVGVNYRLEHEAVGVQPGMGRAAEGRLPRSGDRLASGE
jgi:hypothetical protein